MKSATSSPSTPGSSAGRTRSRAARRSAPRPRPARPRARRRSTAVSSAIRASCSTTSTVSPSRSFSSRTMRKISRTIIGASPSDGSSSISSRGRAISARASGEHLLLAARQRPRLLVARARDPREPLARSGRCPRGARGRAGVRAEPEVLGHGQLGERAPPLGHVRDPGARDRLGPAAERLARERDRARSAAPCPRSRAASSSSRRRSRRARRRSCPSGTSSDTPRSAWTGPYRASTSSSVEEGGHGRVPRP